MEQKNLVPKRRFKEFQNTSAWEQRKLGEIADCFSGGTPSANNRGYYNGNIPFIRSGEIHSNKTELFITEEALNNSSAKLVTEGDILYALYGATSGEVGISQINGAINQAVLAIKPKFGDDSYLITQWLIKQKQTIISTYLQGGQGNLSGSIVKNLMIDLPTNKEEQTKIGSFFSELDKNITLHQRKLEKMKALKSAYLSEMFPAEGEPVPKRRFAGFTQAWEQRKLGEMMEVTSVKRIHQSDWTDEGVRFLRARDIVCASKGEEPTDYLYISQEKYDEYSRISGKVKVGDLLVTGVGTIGVPLLVTQEEPLYFKDGNIIWFKNEKQLDGNFFY